MFNKNFVYLKWAIQKIVPLEISLNVLSTVLGIPFARLNWHVILIPEAPSILKMHSEYRDNLISLTSFRWLSMEIQGNQKLRLFTSFVNIANKYFSNCWILCRSVSMAFAIVYSNKLHPKGFNYLNKFSSKKR